MRGLLLGLSFFAVLACVSAEEKRPAKPRLGQSRSLELPQTGGGYMDLKGGIAPKTGTYQADGAAPAPGPGAPAAKTSGGALSSGKPAAPVAAQAEGPSAGPGTLKRLGAVSGTAVAKEESPAIPVESGTGGACPALPKRVRVFSKDHPKVKAFWEGNCDASKCEPAVELKHYRYPLDITVTEFTDFMERCDYREDTPCPAHNGSEQSIFTQVDLGAGIPSAVAGSPLPGVSVTAVPIVGLAHSNMASDISIPFTIDPRMAGRTYLFSYTENVNNPGPIQISISACEGDFSKGAVFMRNGIDILNAQLLATEGLEGMARIAANTTFHRMALKAGKRYFLNVRKAHFKSRKDSYVPTDEIPDGLLYEPQLWRAFHRGPSIEFYRLGWQAYPAGNPQTLTEAQMRASPDFRRPGESFKD